MTGCIHLLTVPTIEEQSGHKRVMSTALCQDIRDLVKVTQYDYDCSNADFIRYAVARGVAYNPKYLESSGWFKLLCDKSLTREEHDEPYLNDWEHDYSVEDLDEYWKIHRIHKAKLQDVWQLWLMHEAEEWML